MIKRLINIGIISCLFLILSQIISGFFELIQSKSALIVEVFNLLNPLFNITVLIVLWRVLVKYYNQYQLDWVLKALVLILIISASLSIVLEFKMTKIILMSHIGVSLINLVTYLVFINKITDIGKFEVNQIEYLKNYSLAFIFCILGQLALSVLIELNEIDLEYISHFILIIPIVFIALFLTKIKKEINPI